MGRKDGEAHSNEDVCEWFDSDDDPWRLGFADSRRQQRVFCLFRMTVLKTPQRSAAVFSRTADFCGWKSLSERSVCSGQRL